MVKRAAAAIVLAALCVLLTACDRGYVVVPEAEARWHEVLDPTLTTLDGAPAIDGLLATEAGWGDCVLDSSPQFVYDPTASRDWLVPEDAVTRPRNRLPGVVLRGAATLLDYLQAQGWRTYAVDSRRAGHDFGWRPVLNLYRLVRAGGPTDVTLRVSVGTGGVRAQVLADGLPRLCRATHDA